MKSPAAAAHEVSTARVDGGLGDRGRTSIGVRAVARAHPEDGTVVGRDARAIRPRVPVNADGAERASSVAAGGADGEPPIIGRVGSGREERLVDTARVGAERRGLLVGCRDNQVILIVTEDGVDVERCSQRRDEVIRIAEIDGLLI